ncbi:GNAT family N-acetyltransferase [Chloroflexota bacterium]
MVPKITNIILLLFYIVSCNIFTTMAQELTVRIATRDDAITIHELHIRSVWELCKEHYSTEQLHGWLDHRTPEGYYQDIDKGMFFVAMDGSEVIGFGGAIPGEILAIYVTPDRIKEGIGTIMLQHGMDIGKRDSSIVILDATLNSVGFYQKYGFTEVEKKFIRRGNTELPCILMEYANLT